MNLNPYLIFDGKCREAFEFYAQVFGSKIDMISTFGEAPPEMQVPEGEKDKVMH
ncbi:MAG: VOC family protein, partial [Bacteroidetes bacterium]